jgi:ammonia channel protein AmtB
MSAFCKAIFDARWAAFTAESILSRNLAERMRKRCFFLLEVIRMLFLYFPSSRDPSLNVVTP